MEFGETIDRASIRNEQRAKVSDHDRDALRGNCGPFAPGEDLNRCGLFRQRMEKKLAGFHPKHLSSGERIEALQEKTALTEGERVELVYLLKKNWG